MMMMKEKNLRPIFNSQSMSMLTCSLPVWIHYYYSNHWTIKWFSILNSQFSSVDFWMMSSVVIRFIAKLPRMKIEIFFHHLLLLSLKLLFVLSFRYRRPKNRFPIIYQFWISILSTLISTAGNQFNVLVSLCSDLNFVHLLFFRTDVFVFCVPNVS